MNSKQWKSLMLTDRSPEKEQHWTIWVCPNCGKRQGGAYFCRCAVPSSRCQKVEVIAANHPGLLSKEEAQLIRKAATDFHGSLEEAREFSALMDRLSRYAGESEEAGK
jgi:hypothetical protein